MTRILTSAFVALCAALGVAAFAQMNQDKGGGDETGPYNLVQGWPQNYCGDGYVIGSTAPHVNVDQIKNFRLAIPPLEEQYSIVNHIAAETEKIEATISRTEREIALIQEYRTRLAADVVTGKVDVRQAAKSLARASEGDNNKTVVDDEPEMEDDGSSEQEA